MNQFYNTDTEKWVIGAMLIDSQGISEALAVINSEDIFYSNKHKEIIKAIRKLYHAGKDVDFITVSEEYCKYNTTDFEERKAFDLYLMSTMEIVGSSAHIESHCYILKEMYVRRKLIEICHRNMEEGKKQDLDIFDVYEKTLTDLDGLNSEINRVQGISFSEATYAAIHAIKEAASNKSYSTGIKTGLTELDRVTGGWQPSDLIIIAARPAMGKTALALDIARKQAKEYNKPIAFFSLEMSTAQITQRILSQETLINFEKIRMGGLKGHEWAKLDEMAPYIAQLPLHVCDKGGLTINELCSIAKNWKAKHRIEAIYVDYLTIITPAGGKKNGNREEDVAGIARRLKQLAKELHVPVIALAQLNRGVESRDDKRPMLSDLRESGAIEQEADIVIFPYRDGYYSENADDNSVELIIAKHRNGKVGTVMARSDLATQRFLNADYAPDYTDYSHSNNNHDDQPF